MNDTRREYAIQAARYRAMVNIIDMRSDLVDTLRYLDVIVPNVTPQVFFDGYAGDPEELWVWVRQELVTIIEGNP